MVVFARIATAGRWGLLDRFSFPSPIWSPFMQHILIISCLAITAVALAREPRLRRAAKGLLRRFVAWLLAELEDEPGSIERHP